MTDTPTRRSTPFPLNLDFYDGGRLIHVPTAPYQPDMIVTEADEDTTCPDCEESPCHPECLSGGGL